MTLSVPDGALIKKDPVAVRRWQFNWDSFFPAGVEISSYAITVSARHPDGDTELTVGNVSLAAGNRKVPFSIQGGRLASRYRVANTVFTNESPGQLIRKSVDVLIQEQ